jgi:hypothetical protein
MDEEKKEQVEKPIEKTFTDKVKELVETKIEKLLETGIQVGNIDYFGKLVDIHKDMENEEYWKIKKEVLENDVR